MIIGKVSLGSQIYSNSPKFGSNKQDYENPISRETEKNLSILSSVGGSAVAGAVAYGLTTCIADGRKIPGVAAAVVGLGTLAFTLPSKLYNAKVNAFVNEKEMDVFSRDRDLKTNLTEQVGEEVKNPEVSLDKKLDDNLKLQMANRASVLGMANITPKS